MGMSTAMESRLVILLEYTKFCFNDDDSVQGGKVSVLFTEDDFASEFYF